MTRSHRGRRSGRRKRDPEQGDPRQRSEGPCCGRGTDDARGLRRLTASTTRTIGRVATGAPVAFSMVARNWVQALGCALAYRRNAAADSSEVMAVAVAVTWRLRPEDTRTRGSATTLRYHIRARAEARRDHVLVASRAVDDLEDHEPPPAGAPSPVLEHEEPGAEDEPEPGTVDPYRRADQPAGGQPRGADPCHEVGHRFCSIPSGRRSPRWRCHVDGVDRTPVLVRWAGFHRQGQDDGSGE